MVPEDWYGHIRKVRRQVWRRRSLSKSSKGRMLDIGTDYNGLGKIQYLLAQHKIPVLDTEYTDKVVIHAMTPAEIGEQFAKEVTEGTSGAARADLGKDSRVCSHRRAGKTV